ncbi:hypothetical protein IPdc08_01516 [archaeon]|nr:hypothetical protein IPdc08_01516 [archaeon]
MFFYACPKRYIIVKNNKPEVDYSRCIYCYQCIEVFDILPQLKTGDNPFQWVVIDAYLIRNKRILGI